MIRYLPRKFQSTVQQIYRWTYQEFTAEKIEAELILEANRLQLMKQDLANSETIFSSASNLRKLCAVLDCVVAVPGDSSGNRKLDKMFQLEFADNAAFFPELAE
ncbi:unnamed protein product [Larinioides sclopetarius]|uniref:Uncharacterized protein n=1 Tax=Larinioides sclopetarius TaxID=280406 RepID=A0AAV1ZI10_9ARAC